MSRLGSRSILPLIPFIALLSLFFLPATLAVSNSIYLIRNAETPSLGLEGLTPVGQQRADECLPNVFGPSSPYDIGLVIACQPDINTTDCHTAVATATPVASALGLTVDTRCTTIESNLTSPTCVPDLIKTFGKTSTKGVLVVWDVEHIGDLLDEFDLENDEPDYPEEWPDIIYTIRNDYFIGQTSQECPGIDGSSTGAPAAKTVSSSSFGANKALGGNETFPIEESATTEPDAATEAEATTEGEAPAGETVVPELATTLTIPTPEPTLTEAVAEGQSTSSVGESEPTAPAVLLAQPQVQKVKRVHAKKRFTQVERLSYVTL